MLGKEVTQASKSKHKLKLYSFHNCTIHVRGGIYRGPSLRALHKMIILPPTQIVTTLFNYKDEVVFFPFESSFFNFCTSTSLMSSSSRLI